MTEKHKRLLVLQLMGIGVFNKLDYFLTLDFLEKGFYEANPILASTIGTYEFPLVKLVLAPLLLIFLWQFKDRIGDKITKWTWIPFIGYFSLMSYFGFLIATFPL